MLSVGAGEIHFMDSPREAVMRADDLRSQEVLVSKGMGGFPLFASSRIMVMGTRSLGHMQADMIRILGKENAVAIMGRHGYEAGMATAMAMAELYDWDSDEEWFKAGSILRSMAGLAHEKIFKLAFDKEQGRFYMEGEWRDSLEATQFLRQHDQTTGVVCCILSGWASGYASACMGKEIWVQEISCRAQGNRICRFEGRPADEWRLLPEDKPRFLGHNSIEDTMSGMRLQLKQAWKEVEDHRAEIQSLREQLDSPEADDRFVYRSEEMERVRSLAQKVAATDSTILITGESGTGKEVLVRYIHRHSPRLSHPFLAIDCAAMPKNLLESELFGHVKGAFTGAERNKTGLFVVAGAGTLFLDEIGELPIDLQVKLLRVLQERVARPVGGIKTYAIKARIVAATNRDLGKMVTEGSFREDLYYRLAVIPIHVPPLRQRRQDILPLARYFLNRFSPDHPGFTPAFVRRITTYDWPGNIRELENAIEHASVLAGSDQLSPEHLPLAVARESDQSISDLMANWPSETELVRRYTGAVLRHTGQNRTRAARILGINPSTLWRRLESRKP
ncbi:MAG: AAA family ATPase [Desulfobacteraceae bacterium]|jgi:DNA-binding NtrC family response regulator/predicted hydrocarbon binding protein|nr:MAG: AAA family ATPase [Desulfobacteraceae bacterium]